jgi:phage shock protein C
MANRERTRPSPESSSSPREAFEAGKTTLDLDDISEEALDSLYFEDDEAESSLFNLQTVSGLGLILAGLVYLLTEIGAWSDPTLLGLGAALPWLVGTATILLGLGVLTWRSSDSRPAWRPTARAVDADGEPTVVTEPPKKTTSRLLRSRTDKKLFGVCGGIAEYLNLDATLVRVAFVVATLMSFGPLVLAYLALAFVIPKEPPRSPTERSSVIPPDDD